LPQPVPTPVEAADGEAPARRRRGRPRAENGAEPPEAEAPDATSDGAAALAAFPE
jgi:hypothetical protein